MVSEMSGPVPDDSSGAAPTAAETDVLSRLLGLEIPPEDRELLAEALGNQRSLVAAFDGIAADAGLTGDDLTRTMPDLCWDPRWR
jgi:hypothetical protein